MRHSLVRVVALAGWVVAAGPAPGAARAPGGENAGFVWIEAEKHTECNFPHFQDANMGKPDLLSGGRWILKGMSPEEVARLVPDEGIRLKYAVASPRAGRYDLWARLGFFHARADMEWRVGDGQWTPAPAAMPTTNLMELGFFCEASWWRLGAVDLPAGATTLEVRYPKTPAGGDRRMLVAQDCFAFVQGPFTPEGPLKPGQTYSAEADRRAAEKVFQLPAAQAARRVEVELNGPWQVARYDDPNMDAGTYEPVAKLPGPEEYDLRWMAFDVPGNPWKVEPLVFGHRLIYRTRVNVPADHKGRGFKLHFSGTNWIVSVFVNGRPAGTHRGVWVPWDLDVSALVRPGEVNELAVAVKGTYYAMDAQAMGKDKRLEPHSNRPLDRQKWTRWVAPIYPSVKGDGDGYIYGIVNPVTLVSVGDAYTEDVFIRPSVQSKRLEADVTVRNTADRPRALKVLCEAVYDRDGTLEKRFEAVELTVPAGGLKTVLVGGDWADPRLWWPSPAPDLYRLRTTVSEGGRALDVQEELFGFREVTVRGTGIHINGVRRNFWNWVDVHLNRIDRPEQWAEAWREERNRFMRFSHGRKITSSLPSREQRLEFYDRNGIPGRLCTMIDGMFISYDLGNRTKDKDGRPLLIVNEPVWENFREHMAQVARAYRNHPSVIFYQVENELVYINGMNIYGGYLDKVEELMGEVCQAGRKIDPTRPYTVGGAGDLSGRLEINSPHYPHAAMDYYPENAYAIEHYATKIERWPWDRSKPWVVGESLFADELRLGACVAGDVVFRGTEAARRGKAKFLRMIYGGYRWAGVAGFFPWDNLWEFDDAQKIFSDLCAVPRKQTSRLFAGRENRLLFKVMNDTLSPSPVTLEWTYRIGGKAVASDRASMDIEPGFGKEHEIVIAAPDTDRRLDGLLTIRLAQAGAADYVDERLVPVLPTGRPIAVAAEVHVLDRKGATADFLAARGVKFERIDSLDAIKGKTGVLVIGHDSLTPAEAFGTRLLGFAVGGGRVICLAQENAPAGSALPAPIKPTPRFGGYAHPQAIGSPIFADLGPEDLIDWAGDHPTYRNAYQKPSQGGRALAESGGDLELSPLVEVPCGDGMILLCQLRVAEKLGHDPAAEVLLRNFLHVYGSYRPAAGVAALVAPESELLAERAGASGILMDRPGSVAAALEAARYKVALIHASPANLQALLADKARAEKFQDDGGWIMLSGLDPKGLDAFNRLVGADHMLRPFRIERVTLQGQPCVLAATLGNRDVALQDAMPLMHGRYWVSGDTFSYVIDGRDFAPFTQPPGGPADPYEYKPTREDHDPFNFVNGMLREDDWRYIRQIWVPETGADPLVFTLRRPDWLDTVRIWNNTSYWTIEKLDVILDGDEAGAIHVVLPDADHVTEVKLPRPVKVSKTITLQIRSWRQRPTKRPDLRLVGIDNVQFLRPAGPDKAVYLDSVGGLVAFPRGKGGVLLNQVKFMADEPRKDNDAKKVRILGVLMQNMGVALRSASVVAVPGVNVRFQPITLQEHGNAYLDARSGKAGWFGEKGQDLAALPRGRQDLADVTYHVVDYATAPTPDCVMVAPAKGRVRIAPRPPEKVEGIRLGVQADLLYFLHTADVLRPVTQEERSRMTDKNRPFTLPTVAKYVLHYADGKTAEIPIVLERNIDHWAQAEPLDLSGARLAWSYAVEALAGKRATIYSMQAPNPRPAVLIERLDVVVGEGKDGERAVTALLAVSAGKAVRTKE